jgi:hypothetical protein
VLRYESSPAPSATAQRGPAVVPYEWFKPRPERPNVKTKYQRILLLWFNEDILAAPTEQPSSPEPLEPKITAAGGSAPKGSPRTAPLQQYARLLCGYLKQPNSSGSVKILGPQLSTTLKAMVDEAASPGLYNCPVWMSAIEVHSGRFFVNKWQRPIEKWRCCRFAPS